MNILTLYGKMIRGLTNTTLQIQHLGESGHALLVWPKLPQLKQTIFWHSRTKWPQRLHLW